MVGGVDGSGGDADTQDTLANGRSLWSYPIPKTTQPHDIDDDDDGHHDAVVDTPHQHRR